MRSEFQRETPMGLIYLDEAVPGEFRLQENTRRIWFRNSSGAPVDRNVLTRSILGEIRRKQIIDLTLDFSSKMTSLWVAALFPQVSTLSARSHGVLRDFSGLESLPRLYWIDLDPFGGSPKCDLAPLASLRITHLDVAAMTKEETMAVSRCLGLKALHLGKWPHEDLTTLASLSLESLAIQGKMRTLSGLRFTNMQSIRVSRSPRFASLRGVGTRAAFLESCPQFDPTTLVDVDGLEDIHLASAPSIDSLEFLRHCKTLKKLTIVQTDVTTADLSPIEGSATLEQVFGPFSSADVERIGRAKHNLVIWNGFIRYNKGQREVLRPPK